MVLSCVCIGRESFDHVIPRELSLGFSHTLDPKAGIVLSLSLSVNANDDSGLMIFYACMMYVYVWVCSFDHCHPPLLQSMRQHLQYLCLAPPAAGGGVTGAK